MVPNSLSVRTTALCVGVCFLLTCEGSSTTEVTEYGPVAVIEMTPGVGTIEMGETLQLRAIPKDANGNELHLRVTWANMDPFAVEANCNTGSVQFPNTCDVSAVGWGTAGITATIEGIRGLATIEVPDPRAHICPTQAQIPEAECHALGNFFKGTFGPGWRVLDGWWMDTNPCGWHGVWCEEGSVRGLHHRGNRLSGSIPRNLEGLSNLETLDLGLNQLIGPIPPELGSLSSLKSLDLGYNDLIGTIPPELGNLSNLEALELGYNELTGSIPPEFGDLSKLWRAVLWHNQFTGPLPSEIGNMSDLGQLYLDRNMITGSLPPEIGNLSNLRTLTAKYNLLSGSLPAEMGNLANLEYLDLAPNQLSGLIPPELANMSSLQQLDLGRNELRGLVPLGVAQLLGRIPTCTARPGNDGLIIPDTDEYRGADLDSDGLICGVAFWPSLPSGGLM